MAIIFFTILNRSDKNEHPCLVLDLRERAFSLLTLRMILAVGFFGRYLLSGRGSSLLFFVIFIMTKC